MVPQHLATFTINNPILNFLAQQARRSPLAMFTGNSYGPSVRIANDLAQCPHLVARVHF
jgi:hypothetical protein